MPLPEKMTCEEARSWLEGKDIMSLTRAERAKICKHFVGCKQCYAVLMDPRFDPKSHEARIVAAWGAAAAVLDYNDPEFREGVKS